MILVYVIAVPLFFVWGAVCSTLSLVFFAISVKKTLSWALYLALPSRARMPFEKPLMSNAVISSVMICALGALGYLFLHMAWRLVTLSHA